MGRTFGAVIVVLLVGCTGASIDLDDDDNIGPTVPPDFGPPDLVVSSGDQGIILAPYAYCWQEGIHGVCADGAPPDPLQRLRSTDGPIQVRFPLDWSLRATLLPGGEYCEGQSTVDVSAGAFPGALGPSGTYSVEIFGRGEPGTDAAWAFELVIGEDSPGPEPIASLLWYPGLDELDPSAPFGIYVQNVRSPPSLAFATVTITSSSDETSQLTLEALPNQDCWQSTISFEGPADLTSETVGLGPPPYVIEVVVDLDGRTSDPAEFSWPDDFPENSNESMKVPVSTTSELFVGGPVILGAPPVVAGRIPLPYCGAEIGLVPGTANPFGELEPVEGSIDCYRERASIGLPTEQISVVQTIEGDTILEIRRLMPDGREIYLVDATRDNFGAQAWYVLECPHYTFGPPLGDLCAYTEPGE